MTTATRLDWVEQANTHYHRAIDCFGKAAALSDRRQTGDPQAFDQWLRMATWHVQAGGLAVGMARAVSDGASR